MVGYLLTMGFICWTAGCILMGVAIGSNLSSGDEDERFKCEVCGSTSGHQTGDWDFCSRGHSYVGKRAEAEEEPETIHERPDPARRRHRA